MRTLIIQLTPGYKADYSAVAERVGVAQAWLSGLLLAACCCCCCCCYYYYYSCYFYYYYYQISNRVKVKPTVPHPLSYRLRISSAAPGSSTGPFPCLANVSTPHFPTRHKLVQRGFYAELA